MNEFTARACLELYLISRTDYETKDRIQTTTPDAQTCSRRGITEFWYLKHLKPLLGLNIELQPRLFGNETMGNINKLIEEGLEIGSDVICLFDEDIQQWNQVEAKRIADLHKKYDHDKRVTLGCSMPSIEYWFLLHYENTNRHLRTSHDAIKALQKYIAQFDKKENFLRHQKWVAELIKDGKMDAAMKRAEALGRSGSSYTDVWKAIKDMKE